MKIRAAKTEDSGGIARVQVDSYRKAYAGIMPQALLAHFSYDEQAQDWRDLLASDTKDFVCVAESDTGEIVGYALGRPAVNLSATNQDELVALHVRRAYRRQGIGRRLIAAAAERLRRLVLVRSSCGRWRRTLCAHGTSGWLGS